jgi:hypothetical protein
MPFFFALRVDQTIIIIITITIIITINITIIIINIAAVLPQTLQLQIPTQHQTPTRRRRQRQSRPLSASHPHRTCTIVPSRSSLATCSNCSRVKMTNLAFKYNVTCKTYWATSCRRIVIQYYSSKLSSLSIGSLM